MGVSRITVWMIQGNEVKILETPVRWEAWLIKENAPHALLLSCPLDKLEELEQFIKDVKLEVGQEWTNTPFVPSNV